MTAVPVPYDNPHFVMQLSSEQFAYSFWQKCQVTSPGVIQSPRTAKVEALFPGLHGSKAGHEITLYTRGTDALPPDRRTSSRTATWTTSCPFPHRILLQMAKATSVRRHISAEKTGVGSVGFQVSARSCVLWMNLQEVIQGGGRVAQLPGRFHKQVHLLSFQLEGDKLWNVLQGEQGRFWNRQFIDFHLHLKEYHFSELERSTMRLFTFLGLNAVQISTFLFGLCPHNNSIHPITNHFGFMHLYLGRGWNFHFANTSDWLVSQNLVLRYRRAKL